jgi:hypothetical protein
LKTGRPAPGSVAVEQRAAGIDSGDRQDVSDSPAHRATALGLPCSIRAHARPRKEFDCEMATTSADQLHPRAQAALATSPFYELRDLTVEPRGEGLVISGTVSSFYHKQLAQEVVRSVCRDIEIVNSIDVAYDQDQF